MNELTVEGLAALRRIAWLDDSQGGDCLMINQGRTFWGEKRRWRGVSEQDVFIPIEQYPGIFTRFCGAIAHPFGDNGCPWRAKWVRESRPTPWLSICCDAHGPQETREKCRQFYIAHWRGRRATVFHHYADCPNLQRMQAKRVRFRYEDKPTLIRVPRDEIVKECKVCIKRMVDEATRMMAAMGNLDLRASGGGGA